MRNEEKNLVNKILELLTESIERVLKKSLDHQICDKIQFQSSEILEINDAEEFKDGNVLYKIDYATGISRGSAVILLPEKLVFEVVDIITGGNGDTKFGGALTEVEINSGSTLLNKIFKDIEGTFKHSYNQDIAFSANPEFVTKEMDIYTVSSPDSDGLFFNMLIQTTLTLNDEKSHQIGFLLNEEQVRRLIDDLGLFKIQTSAKKMNTSSLDIASLSDVKIDITAELGRARVPIKYALELVRGSLIGLDTLNNSDIKVFANGVEFAYAQVVAIEENFGLKITKIITPEERLECI